MRQKMNVEQADSNENPLLLLSQSLFILSVSYLFY